MARILMAWELGANYGHLTRQLPIAGRLRSAGHDVLFASRDISLADELLAGHAFNRIQAPCCLRDIGLARPLVSYADMLLVNGYGDTRVLDGLIQSWSRLIHAVRADAIIADHSPTALLAARISGVKAVVVGSGFEIPPSTSPLPSIRSWEEISTARLHKAEELALDRINTCLSGMGVTLRLCRVADIFADAAKVLVTFPELDHYGARPGALYAGALYSSASTVQLAWATGKKRRLLVYLRTSLPGLSELLSALQAVEDSDVICAIPGMRVGEAAALSRENFRVIPHAVDFEPLLGSAHLVVCMGGSGLVTQALLRGIPMLLVPFTVEQYLQSKRVELMGAAIVVDGLGRAMGFSDCLTKLLNGPAYRDCALGFKRKYSGFDPLQATSAVLKSIDVAIV